MMTPAKRRFVGCILWSVALAPLCQVHAWGGDGHVALTEAAVELLPQEFPAFVKTPRARGRLAYLSNEPDRWRNLNMVPLGHINKPEHYLDVDLLALYGLDPQRLPRFRHDYVAAIELHKAAHPEKEYGYDPAKDDDRSKEYPGFAPYRICEMYVQLRSSWRTLNTYEKYRETAGEGDLENAQENVIYLMGVMGHYVGDMSQPLHATRHHHGWEGENPKGYTTESGVHALIDDGVIDAAKIDARAILKHSPQRRSFDDQRLFDAVMEYVLETFAQMEPLYDLEKRGAFKKDSPAFAEGVRFIEQRMITGAVMLESLWESAARDAGIDQYREKALRGKAK